MSVCVLPETVWYVLFYIYISVLAQLTRTMHLLYSIILVPGGGGGGDSCGLNAVHVVG